MKDGLRGQVVMEGDQDISHRLHDGVLTEDDLAIDLVTRLLSSSVESSTAVTIRGSTLEGVSISRAG